jgi:hypothetical protein
MKFAMDAVHPMTSVSVNRMNRPRRPRRPYLQEKTPPGLVGVKYCNATVRDLVIYATVRPTGVVFAVCAENHHFEINNPDNAVAE